MVGRKGYIGPLGDDFPSLFPLLLGLLIFFSSLAMAYMVYTAKNDSVKVMRANIMISRAVRYELQFDQSYWNYACGLARGMQLNYNVHLAMWLEYVKSGDVHLVEFNNNPALCPSPSSDEDSQFWGSYTANPYELISSKTKGTYSVIMTYPVIWVNETNAGKVYTPARLVVVTWK